MSIFIFPTGIELRLRSNGSTDENRQDCDNFHYFQKFFTPGVGNFKIKKQIKKEPGQFGMSFLFFLFFANNYLMMAVCLEQDDIILSTRNMGRI